MNFQPINNRRSFEQIADHIRKLINEGTFRPGDRLPPEKEVAKLIHAGRHAVREGLRLLKVSGLIKIMKRGHGCVFVSKH